MRLARSLSWISLSQVLNLILQFCSSVILARFLSPYEMGIYAVAVAAVGVLSILQAFGLQSLIVREKGFNG